MRCRQCSCLVRKRQVLCLPHWEALPQQRKRLVRRVYGRRRDHMRVIDQFINAADAEVARITADPELWQRLATPAYD